MTSLPSSYRGYRFPPDIISHTVWLAPSVPRRKLEPVPFSA